MPDFDTTPERRATLMAFLRRQLWSAPTAVNKDEVDLRGKTAIVTGANTGLGLECAGQLYDLGITRLILAVRNTQAGLLARAELLGEPVQYENGHIIHPPPPPPSFRERIASATGCHDAIDDLPLSPPSPRGYQSRPPAPLVLPQRVEVWHLDLADYESIADFADRARCLDRLDILVNNAGIANPDFVINPSTGHEKMVQVNYLSVALLTVLTVGIMRDKRMMNDRGVPGRIVNVSCDGAAWAKFREREGSPGSLLAALDDEKNGAFDGTDRYYTTKLLGQLFLAELARRVPAEVAVVNAPSPGLCQTGLQHRRGSVGGMVAGYVLRIARGLFARTADVGARAITDAAVRHDVETHGRFLEDGEIQL
ncbi:NAD(P)-binding protein [Apiospora saccharicola]|uniref:NAD(P)-binding protein n=1 Tax=Apiospora saccharicola TaxID=335842 RepID=A0ABR1U3M0_9PEZI